MCIERLSKGTLCDIFLDTHDDDGLGALLCCLPASVPDCVLSLNATNKNELSISQKYFHFEEKVKQKCFRCQTALLLVRLQALM